VRAGSKFERGFTFVELLVVASTVAILASLLLPALARSKESARAVGCRSNLRQLGIALNLYSSEYHHYPTGTIMPLSTNAVDFAAYWMVVLNRNTSGAGDIFHCSKTPYFYNYSGTGFSPVEKRSFGLSGAGLDAVAESDVRAPSEMIALGDSKCLKIVGFGWPGTPAGYPDERSWPHPTRRSNAVFCDGHVESSASDSIPRDEFGEFKPDETHARRWNYDFQPHPETWW
jgi:prepilin-type processing-associated H-X9-DG protein